MHIYGLNLKKTMKMFMKQLLRRFIICRSIKQWKIYESCLSKISLEAD